MIVPMKKVLLLALKTDRDGALKKLRDLGVVEVVSETLADSADRASLAAELTALDRVITTLESRKKSDDHTENDLPEKHAELLATAIGTLVRHEELKRQLDALRKEETEMQGWGEYDPALIATLRRKGVFVYLCESSQEQFNACAETLADRAATEVFEQFRGMCRFAVISTGELADANLPEVQLSERPLSAIRAEIDSIQNSLAGLENDFDALKNRLKDLKSIRCRKANDMELLSVRDGLSDCGEIIALRGFVPAPAAEKLQKTADGNAWALFLSDPEAGETVPVLLEPPKWVKPILPLFQFLGIAPGYEEFDMSPGMLIFFSIFFSMIINDAGYAALMLLSSAVAAILLRKNPKAVMPCRLALLLSFCATAWGICSGAYFGTETSVMQLNFLSSGADQTAHLQLICFVLALVHLSLGHCWRLVNANGFLEIIGQLGWVPILLLDFTVVLSLLVFPGMAIPAWAFIAGGIGLAMVLIGGVDWRDVGAICNFPFDLIGSFTDTLSYVRLFAVGMSGTYMAQSFNNMGMDLWNISPWLIPVALLVIVFGHTLNVALAFMSVLVHGVRLNTLEFSNHAGIRWGGQAYKPLKNIEQ